MSMTQGFEGSGDGASVEQQGMMQKMSQVFGLSMFSHLTSPSEFATFTFSGENGDWEFV